MSLDIYLKTKEVNKTKQTSGIFVRKNGKTVEITEDEWYETHPEMDRPVIFQGEETETNIAYSDNITHNLNTMADNAGIYEHLWRPDECIFTSHCDKGTRLYRTWKNLNARCSGKSNRKCYDNIFLFEDWKNYIFFRRWALLNGYKDDLTIDRINTNDGYYPQNCRWANNTIQAINKNKPSTNKSGFKGVSWRKDRNVWVAKLLINGKKKIIGSFKNKIDAAKAYDDFIIKNNLYHSQNFHENDNIIDDKDYKKIIIAADLIEPLRQGLHELKSRPEHFKQFNPDNGWGTYEGLVEFVDNYLNACYEYPEADVEVDR